MDTKQADKDELEGYKWMTPDEIIEGNATETLNKMLRGNSVMK